MLLDILFNPEPCIITVIHKQFGCDISSLVLTIDIFSPKFTQRLRHSGLYYEYVCNTGYIQSLVVVVLVSAAD